MAQSVDSGRSGPKTGRKGDPRMHRAVAARMENPNLSLFEALRIGGFKYPTDDDSTYVDSENVTLGQRKNQLSRRLRLVRKQNDDGSDAEAHKRPRRSSQSGVVPSKEEKQHLHEMIDQNISTGKKRPMFTDDPLMEDQQEDHSRLIAKYHPQYQPIVVPPVRTMKVAKTTFNSMTANPHVSQGMYGPSNAQQHQNMMQSAQGPMMATRASSASSSHSGSAANGYSGVALSSLSQTASSLGITLEQLAMALSNSSNLAQVLLTGTTCTKTQEDLALNLYRNENRSLYSKCMLMAGYSEQDSIEGSSKYLRFALTAWESEGKRLQNLMAERSDTDEAPLDAKTGLSPTSSGYDHLDPHHHDSYHHGDHSHSHHHHGDHSHSHHHHNPGQTVEHADCGSDGRHIHRLEGKCGHKAVIHQPAGEHAHIDFVVGDRIECYQGLQPVAPADSNSIKAWPSVYACEDLMCADKCGEHAAVRNKSSDSRSADGRQNGDSRHGDGSITPKIMNITDVDFSGNEWIQDFSNDESVLGLFKLGDLGSK